MEVLRFVFTYARPSVEGDDTPDTVTARLVDDAVNSTATEILPRLAQFGDPEIGCASWLEQTDLGDEQVLVSVPVSVDGLHGWDDHDYATAENVHVDDTRALSVAAIDDNGPVVRMWR